MLHLFAYNAPLIYSRASLNLHISLRREFFLKLSGNIYISIIYLKFTREFRVYTRRLQYVKYKIVFTLLTEAIVNFKLCYIGKTVFHKLIKKLGARRVLGLIIFLLLLYIPLVNKVFNASSQIYKGNFIPREILAK